MKEKNLVLSAEILSINEEAHPDYMELSIGVISNQRNLNGVRFTNQFLENAEWSIVDMPLQVDKKELESGNYDNLTHRYDGVEGTLNTDSIGTFVYSTIEHDGDVSMIVATAKVWKRYPKTVEAILELHSEGLLRASVEATVTEYEDINERDYDAYNGRIFAHTLVSNPAEVRASSRMLIAEALNDDVGKMKEEEQMEKDLQALQTEVEKLSTEIASLNEKLNTENEEKSNLEAVVAEKDAKILEMSEEIIGLNEKISESDAKAKEVEESLASVKEELDTYKEAELAEKREELKATAEEFLGEELSEDVQTAIAELNESAVKVAIAEALMAKADETQEEEEVIIASEEEKSKVDIFEEE